MERAEQSTTPSVSTKRGTMATKRAPSTLHYMPVVPCKVTALALIVNGGSQEGETAWRLFALHHEPTSLTRAWKLKLVVNSSSSIEMWTGTRKRVKRGFPNHIRFAWEWHAGWSLESAFGVEQWTTHDLESAESSHRHCQTCKRQQQATTLNAWTCHRTNLKHFRKACSSARERQRQWRHSEDSVPNL